MTAQAATLCPDCRQDTASFGVVDIGTPGACTISGTTTNRYVCCACHFIAWGADARRANGEVTDDLTPKTWRESATRYMRRMRA